ncbi:hypothetical protein [Microcoleus sp.]|uniref:hypothetical protein n=1 Tax=Microcoleus sp. TaxID=44472 RepID=UPI00403E4CF3
MFLSFLHHQREVLALGEYIAVLKKVRYALCPLLYALCPMPYARRVPHVTEKGYISLQDG